MTDQEIYDFLDRTGHLEYAHGQRQDKPRGPVGAAIAANEFLKAVSSFQQFEADQMERLCLKYHGRPAQFDGEIGPATIEAMSVERCGHPDYGPDVQPAIGNGSWPGCHNIGDFHAATVRVDRDGMPGHLAPVWETVWGRVAAAYAALGLEYSLVEVANANIEFSFVPRSNGWIGLAIVGQQESCSSRIWCKYLSSYRPANTVNEWTTLIMHELGHNAGLHHSRGGVMNPSIVQGLAPTWAGDPSESILNRMYGGEPIIGGGNDDEFWIAQGFKSNKGRVTWVPLAVPMPIEDLS